MNIDDNVLVAAILATTTPNLADASDPDSDVVSSFASILELLYAAGGVAKIRETAFAGAKMRRGHS